MEKNNKVILAIGFGLLIIQFFFNRSFYLDEASLALNFLNSTYSDLLKPFSNNQIAPVLFLLVTKYLVAHLGFNDLVFRIAPFLFSIGFISLLYPTLNLLCKDKKVAFYTSLLILTSPIFLRYGTEFKQYSCDLFTTIVLLYITLKFSGKNRNLLLGPIGGILIFLSNISIILLGSISFFLLFEKFKTRQRITYRLGLVFTCWALAFSCYYIYFIANNSSRVYMESFWHYAFLPSNPFHFSFWKWLIQRFGVVFYNFFHYNFFHSIRFKYAFIFLPYLIIALNLLGINHLLKKKRYTILFFCLSPLFIHLILSAFHLYPFSARNSLYLFPLFSLLFVFGIKSFYNPLENPNLYKKAFAYILLISFVINLIGNFPFKNQEVKSNLHYIKERIVANQSLYVFNDIHNVIEFYTYSIPFLKNKEIIYGQGNLLNQAAIKNDIKMLHGEVWFIFAHENPIQARQDLLDLNMDMILGDFFQKTDIDLFLEEIQNVGGNIMEYQKTKGSIVFLASFVSK